MAIVRRFADFLYDFLVDDRWELFIGPLVVLAVVAVVVGAGAAGAVAGILFVALIAAIAAISVGIAVR